MRQPDRAQSRIFRTTGDVAARDADVLLEALGREIDLPWLEISSHLVGDLISLGWRSHLPWGAMGARVHARQWERGAPACALGRGLSVDREWCGHCGVAVTVGTAPAPGRTWAMGHCFCCWVLFDFEFGTHRCGWLTSHLRNDTRDLERQQRMLQ